MLDVAYFEFLQEIILVDDEISCNEDRQISIIKDAIVSDGEIDTV